MRPVIFLDFDGVLRPLPPRGRLCTPKQLARRFDDLRLLRVDPGMCTLYSGIDTLAMSLLAQLCSAFDAQIVLTSSWSAVYPLAAFQPLFRPWHLTQRVIGSVPAGESRPEQIRAWLQAHPRPCWISLDDLPMEEHFPQHAVTTAGVLDEDAYARACAFLQRQR